MHRKRSFFSIPFQTIHHHHHQIAPLTPLTTTTIIITINSSGVWCKTHCEQSLDKALGGYIAAALECDGDVCPYEACSASDEDTEAHGLWWGGGAEDGGFPVGIATKEAARWGGGGGGGRRRSDKEDDNYINGFRQ